MSTFTIPANVPEDYEGLVAECSFVPQGVCIEMGGIEGVVLDGTSLIDLIRNSEHLIQDARDGYVKEAHGNILEANRLLEERKEKAQLPELIKELDDYIQRNSSNMNKATGAFFGKRHEVFRLLTSAAKHTVTALLADKSTENDETLLAMIKKAKEPLILSPSELPIQPGSGPYCTGNRMNMLATELTEKEEK